MDMAKTSGRIHINMTANKKIEKKTLSVIKDLKALTRDLSARLSKQKFVREELKKGRPEKAKVPSTLSYKSGPSAIQPDE